MASQYQAALLVASPSHPNSVAWSNENLVAIASGHIITILNPALHAGPRGLVTLHPDKPFPIGVVDKEGNLLSPCLLPTSLSRDVRPCVRSISWSQPGFAPNSGCSLAVCATGGHVKLYRAPFCDFTAEWIEVVDISELLYKHLESSKFVELNASEFHNKQASTDCTTGSGSVGELQESLSSKGPGRRDRKTLRRRDEVNEEFVGELSFCSKKTKLRDKGGHFAASNTTIPNKVAEVKPRNFVVNDQSLPSKVKGISSLNGENNSCPLITAKQCASRSALLSSLIVAWSPVLTLRGSKFAILAVGAKSGNIFFWKICTPQYYTVEHGGVPVDAILIGLLQAHSSWITAISWGVATGSCSKSQLVMATGSCDGSVKIWLGDVQRLVQSIEATNSSFSLLTEVTNATSAPVSTISFTVPAQSQDKIFLAIGRGSGSLEMWIYCLSSNKIKCPGISEAHDQVVTGLAWAFDGHCLYSCSQDNSVGSWILHGGHLHQVPFPSNFPGIKNSTNLSQVSDQCFGLALAPGELMVAAVRSLEANLLNQMYQARTQRAVVEFFWTGGQLLEPLEKNLICGSKPSGLSKRELQCWECNILLSLKNFENVDKLPVLWDTIAALLVLKNLAPTFVRDLLSKWISSWFPEKQESDSMEKTLSHVQNMLSMISSRRIHLLNIISRRLMLRKEKAELHKWEQHNFGERTYVEGEMELWHNFLVQSERELQQRDLNSKAVPPCVLHLRVIFWDFRRHLHRVLRRISALRRFFSSDPSRRVSVRGLPRATPIVFFNDSCAVVFTTGRATTFIFSAPPHFGFFLDFSSHLVTPFSAMEFLDSTEVFLGFLRARASDRGVQVLVSHLHIAGNIIVIFLDFLGIHTKVSERDIRVLDFHLLVETIATVIFLEFLEFISQFSRRALFFSGGGVFGLVFSVRESSVGVARPSSADRGKRIAD